MIFSEIVAIGIYDSQIAPGDTLNSQKRKTTMFEIELPIQEGGISYIDSSSKKITENIVICAKPGQTRHTKFPFKCYYVHMIIHGGILYDKLINTADFFETQKAKQYEKIFSRLVKHYTALSDSKEILLQSLLLELIYLIDTDPVSKNKSGIATGTHSTVEKALRYIEMHLTENLSLDQVAQAVSLSPTYFHVTFKTKMGKTLRDYVEERRINKSIHLLLTTNWSLTQIAYECGFSSQSYFSYAFKRRMKKTPREYVQEIYNKYEI